MFEEMESGYFNERANWASASLRKAIPVGTSPKPKWTTKGFQNKDQDMCKCALNPSQSLSYPPLLKNVPQ